MNKPIHPAVAEHVMEENEKLRGLLREVIACQAAHYGDGTGLHLAMITLADRLKGALSQQAEPRCEYCDGTGDVHRPDGEWLGECKECVEPAPAQDEQNPERLLPSEDVEAIARNVHGECSHLPGSTFQTAAYNAILYALERITRPAQIEQQPVAWYKPYPNGLHAELRLGAVLRGVLDAHLWKPLYAAPVAQPAQSEQHPDDRAVDLFAESMKAKLEASRAKGRYGWENKDIVDNEVLAEMLVQHLAKGNEGTFEDVANFAMMLHQRGADPKMLADEFASFVRTEQCQPAAWKLRLPDGRFTLEKTFPSWADGSGGYTISPLYAAPVTQPAQTELVEALRLAMSNSRLVPDPAMQGSTELYAMPIDDFEALEAALAAQGGRDE